KIWSKFLGILAKVEKPVLLHYGGFEAAFLKKMCKRYGGPAQGSGTAIAIEGAVNVLGVLFAQIYFPTYSNGLKDVARALGFKWSDPLASGTRSVLIRHAWEQFHGPDTKEWLVTYNAEDCEALAIITINLRAACKVAVGTKVDRSNIENLVNVESLTNQTRF